MTIKEYLSQLIYLDKDIQKKQEQLDNLRAVSLNTTSSYDTGSVQRTRDKNPLETIMAKIIDLDREINDDIDRLVDLKVEVWGFINRLDDEKTKRILWSHYANRNSWKRIGEAEKLTRRHVMRIHTMALKKLEKIKNVTTMSS